MVRLRNQPALSALTRSLVSAKPQLHQTTTTRSVETLAFEEVHSSSQRPSRFTAFVLHGLLGSGRNWRSFSRNLASYISNSSPPSEWRLVLVDLRNHGRSAEIDSFGPPHDMANAAKDLADLVKSQGWDWPDVVLGHSMGGKVALQYAQSCARGDYGKSVQLPKQALQSLLRVLSSNKCQYAKALVNGNVLSPVCNFCSQSSSGELRDGLDVELPTPAQEVVNEDEVTDWNQWWAMVEQEEAQASFTSACFVDSRGHPKFWWFSEILEWSYNYQEQQAKRHFQSIQDERNFEKSHSEQLWVLDSVPGEVSRDNSDGEVEKVLQTLQSLPLPIPSRKWLVDYMVELGFSKSLSEWIGSNLKKSGDAETWAFNLEGAVQMFNSYRETEYWSLLEHPPKEMEIAMVCAEKSDRWETDVIQRLESLSSRGSKVESQGKFSLHVLPNSGHWVHVDNPKGLLDIVAPRIASLAS